MLIQIPSSLRNLYRPPRWHPLELAQAASCLSNPVTTGTAAHRQRSLAEQGYAYTIVDADDVLGPPLPQVD